VVTSRDVEVKEIIDCFEAYWTRQNFDPGHCSHLIRCPTNGRGRLAEFIDDARYFLFVQSERYQYPIIIERRVRAARRRVKSHIMARRPHTLKKNKLIGRVGGLRILDDLGARIHNLKHLKLHAKMILAEGIRGIAGSINLAPGSLDSRRELAIEVRDPHCSTPGRPLRGQCGETRAALACPKHNNDRQPQRLHHAPGGAPRAACAHQLRDFMSLSSPSR
jgi:cardiolipin synthase